MALKPLYYMLGQDVALKGSIVGLTWLVDNKDEDLDDAEATIRIYDHAGTAVGAYTTLPAAMLSNTQSAGDKLIVAYDCTAFRGLLANSHTGGFWCVKRTDGGSVGGAASDRWGKAHGESYDNIAAADTAVRADITGGGDTVDPKGFFLSFGYREANEGLAAVDAAFKADLQQLILDLRTDYALGNTPVVLDLPPKLVAGASAGQAVALVNARRVIMEVASLDANVGYINADSLPRRDGGSTILEKMEYTGEATMDLGRLIAAEMKRLVDGKVSAGNNGMAVVILIGEGDVVGQVEDSFVADNAEYDTAMAASQIWDWGANSWTPYDAQVNSNTEADGPTKFGIDVTLIHSLDTDRFTNGLLLFKLGRNDSALGNPAAVGGSWLPADGDIYTTLLTEWGIAKAACVNILGVVPDLQAIILVGGEGDVTTDALVAAYANNLDALIAQLRLDFQTRTGGSKVPVILAQMKDTEAFDGVRVKTVRDAQEAWVAADGAAKLVDIHPSQFHSDNIHLSGEGLLEVGALMAGAVDAVAT